jgi:D-amino-acid dehydrogenase
LTAPKRVVIVGAGIAGLCCAYYLRRRDVEVVVLHAEAVGSPKASSYGNGGWICPAQAGPLPEPGLGVYGLRAMAELITTGERPAVLEPFRLDRFGPLLGRRR